MEVPDDSPLPLDRRNSIHRYPPELKSAIRVISKLKRTIQEVEHEKQD